MGTSARAPVSVEFKATGLDEVRNGMRLVKGEGEQGNETVARGAQRAAGAISEIAHAGEAGQRSLKELITSGSEIALTFGAGGPIIGALGLLGLTIFNIFDHARKQIEETRRTAEEELQHLRESNDLPGAAKLAAKLYSGDPFAVQQEGESDIAFDSRRMGILALQKQIALMKMPRPKRFDERGNVLPSQAPPVDPGVLKQYEDALDKLLAKYKPLIAAVGELEKKRGDEDQARLSLERSANRPKEIDAQVQALTQLAQIHKLTAPDLERAAQLESQFTAALAQGNLAASERLRLEHNLAAVRAAQSSVVPNTLIGNVVGGKLPNLMEMLFPTTPQLDVGRRPQVAKLFPPGLSDQLIKQFADQVQKPLEDAIRTGMASTLGNAIADGISAGFEGGGIAGAFKAAGKSILAGLGGIIEQMGEVWMSYGISMTALGQALWNPLTSGPAALAIGAALVALGASLGAIAHGRGGGGAAAAPSLPQIIDRGFINLTSSAARGVTARDATTNQYFVIGTDPKAWRDIQGQLDVNARRSGRS